MQTIHIILIVVAAITLGLIVFLEINRRKTQKEERSWMDIKHDVENDPLEIKAQADKNINTEIELEIDSDELEYTSEDETQLQYTEPAEILEQINDNQDEEELITEDLTPEDADENKVKPATIKTEDSENQVEFNFSKTQDVEAELADDSVLQIEDVDVDEFEYENEADSETIVSKTNPLQIEPEKSHSEYDEMFALSVIAQGDDFFEGADLIREFTAQNLQFGDEGFYHRAMPGMQNINLFSVTNIMQPGKFDLKTMLDLRTKGLLLFMHLPGKLEPTQAFDQFYDAADALAITLGGKVCDEYRNTLSQHRLGQIRDKIRHLELKLELERKKASKKS